MLRIKINHNIRIMKKSLMAAAAGLAMIIAVSCSNNNKTTETADSSMAMSDSSMTADTAIVETAHCKISNTKSDTTGSALATFTKNADGSIQMALDLDFPKMGGKSVAVHLHEHGDCGDEGKGAHGHWNPTGENHGKWGSAAYHSGDIGNISLDASGKGSIQVSTDRWALGGSGKTNILGRAIIVHSGVDDYTTQPSGNSGSRIGCGVIMPN